MPTSFRRLAAVAAGNALEFYDFLIFGFFAVQIGQAFFPKQDSNTALLLTLATFGVGFLTRPLGGVVIGGLGDRLGRRFAMMLSFGLMGAAIIGLALTPSYDRIGVAAPLLALFFRLLQGFAIGGEVGPSTAYLMEVAPPGRRGFFIALQFATQQAANLSSGLVGLLLAQSMSPAMLSQWGWRIAMLLGAAIVPLGLVLRYGLYETLAAPAPALLPRLTQREMRLALLSILMLAAITVSTYMMNYMVTFGSHTLGLTPLQGFGAVVATGLCGMLFNPLGGLLADRYGARRVILIALPALLAATLPVFLVMAAFKTPLALYAGSATLSMLLALGTPAVMLALSEGLPAISRSGGIGIAYGLAISIFGGSAQFVVAWLTGVLHTPLAPGFYMSAVLVTGIIARLLLPVKAQA